MEMTTLDELNAAIDRLEYLALARAENANDRNDARSAAERAHAAINALPKLLESARELQALKRSQALDELVAISQEAGLYDDPPLSRPTPDVPGAEEVEAIRARHEADCGFESDGMDNAEWRAALTMLATRAHADRATLLRLLDAAREELREVKEAAVISIPTDLAKLVINIGVAEWGSTHAETADGHADHVRESVRKTAEHFGQTEPQQMHGLYIAGTETVICHTGTSPNSPQIARALTGAWNNLVELSAAALKAPPTRAQGEKP